MSASRLCVLSATLATALASAGACHAQAYGAEQIVEQNNLNWFEPTELDLDGRIDSESGFFFHYDKLYWNATGERQTIGQEGLSVPSEQIYRTGSTEAIQVQIDNLTFNGFAPDIIGSILGISFRRDASGAIVTQAVSRTDDQGVVTTVQSPQLDPTSAASPLQPYNVQNGIQDAPPDAAFAWGDRYEFGYSNGERGWSVGVLQGPSIDSHASFGAGDTPYGSQTAGRITAPGATNLPGTDPAYLGNTITTDPLGNLGNGGPTFGFHALGFGSVPVNFELPNPTFLTGFRDYQLTGGATVGTVYGPVYYVGNYGAGQESVQNVGTGGGGGGGGTTVNGAVADDLNGNAVNGQFVITADLNGDGTIDDDEVIARVTDFGDLYNFNVFFDRVNVRNRTQLDGVEWMLTHELDTRHHLEQGRNDHLQFSYGVRYFRLQDRWNAEMLGSILGRTTINAQATNQIVGPQLGLKYTRDRGPWDFSVDARFVFGYNRTNVSQNGIFGEEAIPGALNRSAVARTTASQHGKAIDDFSPLGELRLDARYKFSRAIALTAGYSLNYVDNIQRASRTVQWRAPDFGIRNGNSDVFINGLNFGCELRY